MSREDELWRLKFLLLKVFFRKPCLPVIAATAAVMMAGCPLPFEYNGQNAGNAHTSDPSTPDITASVVVSYSEQGGSSGTVTDGVPFVSSKTTVVTLSTRTANAVIFYTDDGTIPTIATAKRMSSSSGQITLTGPTPSRLWTFTRSQSAPTCCPARPPTPPYVSAPTRFFRSAATNLP